MVKNPFYYSVATRLREDIFLSMLSPERGDRILDIGCGLGYFTDMLSPDGVECTGIDLDQKCIEYCKRHMRGEYTVGDVAELPYSDNSFNKILCTEVLEHIQENGKVLDEIVRVAENSSTVVVSTPCSSGVFRGLFKRIGHGSVDSNSLEYHWHKGYTRDSLTELLLQHSITPLDTQYTLVFWGEIYTAITKLMIQALQLKKINSQSNALEIMNTWAWRVNVATFPFLYSVIRQEQSASKYLKGHMIIMKGRVDKRR